MDTRQAGTGADADEARVLLEQALRYNEAEAASSRRVLDALVQDGAASSDSMGNVVAAARYSLADTESILAEISAAYKRLDAGTYGTCEVCGHGIGVERLRLRPYVRTCVGCAGGAMRP